ncbi:hypothetical protein BG004_007532 [Podila humilis]|nr:hypothetical protein BG004_007532 [Podila humilis]
MISLTPALGLVGFLLGALSMSAAAPVPSSSQLTERGNGFNPRQKWQVNEVNCVQILNPSPGATYHPGYFVRMNYGTGQCGGAAAAGPWSIHLYNNPEIQVGGKIRYDYHEVLADGINERHTQYVWNIPTDQDSRARNVRKEGDYYVRIETNSEDGTKLVGNAGPFAIASNHPVKRADDKKDTDSPEFNADFALVHRPNAPAPNQIEPPGIVPVISAHPTIESELNTEKTDKSHEQKPLKPDDSPTVVPDIPVVVPDTPVIVPDTPDVVPDTPAVVPDSPAVVPDTLTVVPAAPATSPELADTPDVILSNNSPLNNGFDEVPTPHNLPPNHDAPEGVPVTPILKTSIIPSKALVVAALAGGAIAGGYGGGSLFGTIGGALGALLGSVVGGLAVVGGFAARAMSSAPSPPITHPLEFLIGTWRGKGRGFYPTIPEFHFFEEISFTKDPAGRPVVAYVQKTRRAIPNSNDPTGSPVAGPPMHAESGFIRLPGWSPAKCELILSQPTGVASVELGTINDSTVEWRSSSIVRSPSAKPPHVTEFTRYVSFAFF